MQYIRDFQVETIPTYSLNSIHECHYIMKIITDHLNLLILKTNNRRIAKNIIEFTIMYKMNSDKEKFSIQIFSV